MRQAADERYSHMKEILEDHRERLRRSLTARLGELRAHDGSRRPVVQAPDSADGSVSELEQEFDVALAELAARALRQVNQALARLETGDYGVCIECSEPIPGKRLRALPFVVRCRACEELREAGERARRLSTRGSDFLVA